MESEKEFLKEDNLSISVTGSPLMDEMFEVMYQLANQLIQQICDHVIENLNSAITPDILLQDTSDYPDDFSTFDVLSIEFQIYGFNEINPFLEGCIEQTIESIYKRLSDSERFVLDYSFTDDSAEETDFRFVLQKIKNAFVQRLNDNYSSEKIENYLL